MPTATAPRDVAELEQRLATPTAGAVSAIRSVPGDVIVLGAGGKMGPSLARMLRNAAVAAGDTREVIAVSRFRDDEAAATLRAAGIRVIRADLTDPAAVDALPGAPNVFFLAGQKFGTRDDPSLTWITNVVVPALAARRFAGARIVALSTGNVYPLTPVDRGGSREEDPPGPVGEYAWSCLARERIFEHATRTSGTRVALVRLNYAVDLRYGVLVDLAQRVASGTPIDLRMGHVNVIWQGDACAQAIQCLPLADTLPFFVNVTGVDTVSVRDAARRLGGLLDRTPVLQGSESDTALLSNTSRAASLFGPPSVDTDTLLSWVGEWVSHGGITLGKATHYEQREGAF